MKFGIYNFCMKLNTLCKFYRNQLTINCRNCEITKEKRIKSSAFSQTVSTPYCTLFFASLVFSLLTILADWAWNINCIFMLDSLLAAVFCFWLILTSLSCGGSWCSNCFTRYFSPGLLTYGTLSSGSWLKYKRTCVREWERERERVGD